MILWWYDYSMITIRKSDLTELCLLFLWWPSGRKLQAIYMIRQKGRLTNRKIEDVAHTDQRRESFRLDLGSFPTTPVDSEGNAWDPYCKQVRIITQDLTIKKKTIKMKNSPRKLCTKLIQPQKWSNQPNTEGTSPKYTYLCTYNLPYASIDPFSENLQSTSGTLDVGQR